MKIDSYMPFYGNDFFQALAGRDETVVCGYLKAIWHYWHHTHCEGLEDDDEFLRRLCGVEAQKWARTKPVIFGKYFVMQQGRWHQLRAKEEHDSNLEAYKEKVERINKARELKSGLKSELKSDLNTSQHISGSGSGSGYIYNTTTTEEVPETPIATPKEVLPILALVKERFKLPALDATIETIRANIGELLARGYTPPQIESVVKWATSDKARHLKGRPQSAVNATDPQRFSQWLTTMDNHRAEIEAEAKRRSR